MLIRDCRANDHVICAILCVQEKIQKIVICTTMHSEKNELKAVLQFLDNVFKNYPEVTQNSNEKLKKVHEREKLTV